MSCLRPFRLLGTLVLLTGMLALPASAPAAIHPNHAQGFEPEKLYQFSGLENVNVFNGNLNLALPIGPGYSVGGSLSYGLTLSYMGNVWEWEESVAFCSFGGQQSYAKAIPRKRSNAGFGWELHLGRMHPPVSLTSSGGNGYESPDGAIHELHSSLHADGSSTSGFAYTQDGTYLRYNTSTRVLEFPDGTLRRFDSQDRLTSIEDRLGNAVSISYLTSPTRWVISDGHRTHTIYFKAATHYTGGVVDKVVLAAFNGTSATYTFQHTDADVVRGQTNQYVIDNCGVPRTIRLPLLTGVVLPDGSKFSMPTTDYDLGPTTGTSSLSGHIRRMTVPTGGKMEWDWGKYIYPLESFERDPLRDGHAQLELQLAFTTSVGLVERRHKSASGSLVGRWTYSPALDPNSPQKEHRVTVTDPLGHPSVHYFSVYSEKTLDPAGWHRYEYGLPFSRYTSDGTSPGRYLSAEIKKSGGTVLRRAYVRYERDGSSKANPRLASERTIYVDDGSIRADTNYSDFDGLGHYRQVRTDGTFAAGNVRTTYTNYNPGSCATCTPSTSAPWVLGTFNHQTVTEGSVTAKTEACFEAGTGFLLRTRTLKTGTTQGAADLVTRYTKDAKGNITAEEYFGGDTQSLGTGGLCGLALPTARYRINHAYQYGSLRTSQYQGMPFKSVDRDIDANTGLVKTSRDSALLATPLEYDSMGRLTYVKPSQEGWTQFVYGAASGTTPAKVWIYRKPNGGGTALTTEELHFDPFGRVALERRKMADGTLSDRKTVHNALGWATSKTEWGTTYATSFLGYDPFGRPGTIRPPEGSVHDVVLTYKGVRQVSRTVKVGTGWNGTAVTETQATTTEIYDREGRLYQVFEPANPDGTNSTTTYAYDVGGRLKQVSQTAKNPAGTASTQTRLFTYDHRGFLTSERHPEKGSSGNGYVNFYNYDARGHAGRVVDGPSDLTFTYDGAERVTQVKETGSGGRVLKALTYATTIATGDWRLGKLQVARGYNHVVIGTTPYTVELAETYTYGGKQGRVSKRDIQTWVNGGAGESFTQSWTWNDLGNPASVTYPKCTHTGCTATTTRTATPTYTNGFLTGVSGYASAITYHPNGQVNQVTHVNDPANSATWVTDTHYKDPYNRPQPNKIDAKLGTTLVWNSGVHAYDGAGNMVKAGSAYFLYDPVSRVKSGLLYLGPGAGGTSVSFSHSYDGFGNVHSLTANTTTRSTPTSTTTNRLTGSVIYDAAGNLTYWNGAAYEYDRQNQMWHMKNGTEDWLYLYTADGERLWSYSIAGKPSRWTLRDLDGKVLREYENAAGTWKIQRDYVYRGSQLLAAHTADAAPNDRLQFHQDHLGTPRAITNKNGARIDYHVYYPFGEEATAFNQDTERMKFTGHERDLANTSSAADDLDYMHARFYNPQTGRFLSTDPVDSAQLGGPQSWNKYGYALNNPLRIVDPSGESPVLIFVAAGVVGGLIFGAEAANAPESPDAPVVKSTDGMKAVAASSVVISVARAAMEALGLGRGGVGETEVGTPEPKSGSEGGPGAHKRFSQATREAEREKSNDQCVFCGKTTTNEPGPDRSEIDHAIPASRGGNNSPDNAQNTCRDCNRKKATLTTEEFLRKKEKKPPKT